MVPTTKICVPVPTLEGILELVANGWDATAITHPILTGLFFILWSYYPKFPFQVVRYVVWGLPKCIFVWFLRCLGFGEEGIEPDSYASRYQSTYYGAYIPEDSHFAHYQSYGALPLYRTTVHRNEEESSGLWDGFGWALFVGGLVVMVKY
ncbi:hypothetical protein GALMADRAFT_241391 [Galerina marginata CBS 339.88]|uniref:Uncharacterized protein n=1 Tax=Galerina marginata (strain CBS 339.88) TaxID=685588 RepID=A0A067TPL4_GALM3|nr:hypothetical protein GALMADRAFT_241391 [Galerina marginata CBS 339.88]